MKARLNILVVEDSADDTLFLVRELKRGGYDPVFERVETGAKMEAALSRQTWDVVVSDNSMPEFGSLEALALLKQKQPGVPFIVVSGSMGKEQVTSMLKAGASDFVAKNQMSRLAPSIERRLFETAKRRLIEDEEQSLNASLLMPQDNKGNPDLQVTREYLAAIVESCEDAIIGQALDGVILSWNAGAEAMYGFTAAEMRGQSISHLIPSRNDEEMKDLYGRIGRGTRIARYEAVRIRKDGTVIDVSLTLSPIKDAAGKINGISAIERDITAQKREEAVRLKLIRELTEALGNATTLRGVSPICSSCRKIRDGHGAWRKIESYVSEHTGAQFTHGICPDCMARRYPDDAGK